MKKGFILYAILFAALTLVGSCQKDEGTRTIVNVPYTFSVCSELNARTTLNADNTVEFEAGDAISVLTVATNDKFLTENGGAAAKFTGILTAEEPSYTIVYPYRESNAIESSKVSSRIPVMQKATPKSFASDAAVAVGTLITETASATLYNATSILELGISRDDIVAVSFSSKASEKISGECEISVSETPSVEVNGSSSANLVTEYGCVLDADTYDLVIAPAALSAGFDITYYRKGEESGTYQYGKVSYSNAIEFKRNTIKPLGTKDDDIDQWSEAVGMVNADQVADVLSSSSQTKSFSAWFIPIDVESVGFEYKVTDGAWQNVTGSQSENNIIADITVSDSGEYTYRAWVQLNSGDKVYSETKTFYSYVASDVSCYTESFVDDFQNPTAKAWPFKETQPKTFQDGTYTSVASGLQYVFHTGGTFSFNATQGLVLKGNSIGDYIEIPAIAGKTLKAIAIVRGNSNGCHMKVTDVIGAEIVPDRKLNGVEGEYQVFLLNTNAPCRLIFNSVNTFNIRAIILCYEVGSITINPEGTTSLILGDETEATVSFTTKAAWTATLKNKVEGVSLATGSGPSGDNELKVNFAENTNPTKNIKATVVISSNGESAEVEISQSSYIKLYFGDGTSFISETKYSETFSSPSYSDLSKGISKNGEEIVFSHVDGYSFSVKMINGTVTANVKVNSKGLAMTGNAGSYFSTPAFPERKVLRIESNDYSTGKYKKITDKDGNVIGGGETAKGAEDLSWDLNQSEVQAGAAYRWTFHSGDMTTYLRSIKIHYTE